MANRDVQIDVQANDKATAVLRQLQSSISSLTGTVKGLATVGAGLYSAHGLGTFLFDSVKSFAESERALTKFQNVLKTTGNTIGLTSKQVQEFAEARMGLTVFDDDITIAAAAQLARFKNISGETFKETLALAQDMATVMDTDLVSAAQNLGRALSDPVQGLTKLTRAGVMFSDVQKDIIKGMVKAGDTAKAQAVIMAELRRQFEGAAEAEAGTAGGRAMRLENWWGETKERIGGLLVGTVDDARNRVRRLTFQPTIEEEADEKKRERAAQQGQRALIDNAFRFFERAKRFGGQDARDEQSKQDFLKIAQAAIVNQNAGNFARDAAKQIQGIDKGIRNFFDDPFQGGPFKQVGRMLGEFSNDTAGEGILNALFGGKNGSKASDVPSLAAMESRFMSRGRGALSDPAIKEQMKANEKLDKSNNLLARMEKWLEKIEGGGEILKVRDFN